MGTLARLAGVGLVLFAMAGALAADEPKTLAARPPESSRPSPTPQPARPPVVTRLDVRVTDPAARAVAGALVTLVPTTGAYSFGAVDAAKLRTSLTDAQGRARLESLPPGPWTVTVRARGFVPLPLRRVTTGPLDVRLERGGVISGVVRDGDDRRLLAGVRVSVAQAALGGEWQEQAAHNEATTDARGRFRLDGIGKAGATLIARARGYGRGERSGARAGDSVELFLFPGATLSGVIRDDAGQPVKGAVVRAEGERRWQAPPIERSDARGAFQLTGIAPGEYTVVARQGGLAPGIAGVVVQPQAEATVNLTLSPGGYATGRIVDGDGKPLAGRARVEAFDGRALPVFARDQLTAEAKADGAFALGPLPRGTFGVLLSAPGHAATRVEAEIAASGGAVDFGDVALDTGLTLRGRVVDRAGAAVPGALVKAVRLERREHTTEEAMAGPDGAFAISGLSPGRHRVSAQAEGYAMAVRMAEAGSPPFDLLLERGGTITGRVVDASGRPVEEAEVVTETAMSTAETTSGVAAGRSDEGAGRFVLRDAAPAVYVIQVRAEGRGDASRSDVRVSAGATTDVGTLTLGRGGVVIGTVVDSEGRGIPGASVSVERDSSDRNGLWQAETGSTGAFEIRGAPLGPVEVLVHHAAYAEPAPVVAEAVDADKEAVPVRVVLVRGGRIEGRVLHRDGRPFSEGRVRFAALDAGGADVRLETAPVGADGAYVIDRVPPGRATLTVMALIPSSLLAGSLPASRLSGVASRDVAVRENETTNADVVLSDVVVAGRVTLGGQPAPAISVEVLSRQGMGTMSFSGAAAAPVSAGPPPVRALSREDGSYELLVFSPGPARVLLQDAAQSFAGRRVDIPDTDRFELDLELGSVMVSGIVLDKEAGTAIGEASVRLVRTEGEGPASGTSHSGPDGRFSILLEPGSYRLEVSAAGRQGASLPIAVGPEGLSDVRIELPRGLEIAGRLVDASGRAAGSLDVVATGADGQSDVVTALSDGSFRIGSLKPQPYSVLAGSVVAGFGFRAAQRPGGDPITIALRAAGRIAIHVVDAAGRPAKDAYPDVESLEGARVNLMGVGSGPTDATGSYLLPCPPGLVGVVAVGGRESPGTGRGTVNVPAGGTASLELTLRPGR